MSSPEYPTREAAEAAAAAWIARRSAGNWSPSDAQALEAWLGASVSHRVAYYRLNAAWEEVGRLRALSGASSGQDSPTGPSETVPEPIGQARRPGRYALAAGFALLVLAAGWVYRASLSPPNHYTTVVGGLQAVPLADGSRITLNTDSELKVALGTTEREVNLERGEAFFEVAKDKSRPFVVKVGGKRVVAVGTQFSVLRQGDEIQVVVSEGTVRLEDAKMGPARADMQSASHQGTSAPSSSAITPGGSADAVLLPAGTVARAEAGAVLVRKEEPQEIEQHLSWRAGVLVFRDTPLSDAVAELNRYNERKIVIEDPRIATLQLGGIFRSTNIDPFIQLLEQGFPVRARVEGDRILLTHN